jgi:hypothetical protein
MPKTVLASTAQNATDSVTAKACTACSVLNSAKKEPMPCWNERQPMRPTGRTSRKSK